MSKSNRGRPTKYDHPKVYSIRGESWISGILTAIHRTEADALEAGVYHLLGLTESSKKATTEIVKILINRKKWQIENLKDEISNLEIVYSQLTTGQAQWADSDSLVIEFSNIAHPSDETVLSYYRAWAGRLFYSGGEGIGPVVTAFQEELFQTANGNGDNLKAVLDKAKDPRGIIERYLITRGIELSGIAMRKAGEGIS